MSVVLPVGPPARVGGGIGSVSGPEARRPGATFSSRLGTKRGTCPGVTAPGRSGTGSLSGRPDGPSTGHAAGVARTGSGRSELTLEDGSASSALDWITRGWSRRWITGSSGHGGVGDADVDVAGRPQEGTEESGGRSGLRRQGGGVTEAELGAGDDADGEPGRAEGHADDAAGERRGERGGERGGSERRDPGPGRGDLGEADELGKADRRGRGPADHHAVGVDERGAGRAGGRPRDGDPEGDGEGHGVGEAALDVRRRHRGEAPDGGGGPAGVDEEDRGPGAEVRGGKDGAPGRSGASYLDAVHREEGRVDDCDAQAGEGEDAEGDEESG